MALDTINSQVMQDTSTSFNLESMHLAAQVLIMAYARNPEDVEWGDIQLALGHALDAFNLESDYPEQVYAQYQED